MATSEAQRITAEATLAHAIAAKDTTIARLTSQLEEAAQVQHVLEGEVEALQASKEALQAQHVDDETVMLHGLRGEMAVLEQRLRDEQAAHAASIHQVGVRGGGVVVVGGVWGVVCLDVVVVDVIDI